MIKAIYIRTGALMLLTFCALRDADTDEFAPPVWRGQPGSTYQAWGFDTDANPSAPAVVDNPYGIPQAHIAVGSFGEGWLDGHLVFGDAQGFWDLGSGGTITVELPPLDYIEIWVEVTYFEDIWVGPAVTVPGALISGSEGPVEVARGVLGEWYAELTTWQLPEGSSARTVVFTSDEELGSIIDSVIVEALAEEPVVENQISGTIELDSLSPPEGGVARTVVFAATAGSVGALKTWEVDVSFDWGSATGEYVLGEVPNGTEHLSAKTAWHLRQRLPVLLDGNNCATIHFAGEAKLLGGDLNGSNTTNIPDYVELKSNWLTSSSVADINGDGLVNLGDYAILKRNWFMRGADE